MKGERQPSGASRRKEQCGGQPQRARLVLLVCQQSGCRAAVPPGMQGGPLAPLLSTAGTAQEEFLPSRQARRAADPLHRPQKHWLLCWLEGAASTTASGKETKLPSALSESGGQASLPAGRQPSRWTPGRDTVHPQSPRGTATELEPSCQQHPPASSCPRMPQQPRSCWRELHVSVRKARVPVTPPHQVRASPTVHTLSPRAQEIHMLGALQQHKGSSLFSVGICS